MGAAVGEVDEKRQKDERLKETGSKALFEIQECYSVKQIKLKAWLSSKECISPAAFL